MPQLTLKTTHKCVVAYYENLKKFEKLGMKHEGAVSSAFHELLEVCARQFDWKLVPQYPIKRKGKLPLKADGALVDNFNLSHGIWEAKDSSDDLEKEIKAKFALGYPRENILFQEPLKAVLYQQGECAFKADLTKPDDLVHVLRLFFEFAPPAIADWEKAVIEFKDRIPQIGASLKKLIETERQTNKKFIAAFDDFCALCRGSLNPNISIGAVEEMIIQHILTERIFRKIFDVADFISRNVIAQEIEKVITALNSRVFSRDDFSKSLEHFYGAIENAAATISDFTEKQTFLNTVYERFFQGFCVKVSDTHGIVYTPQPLVNFMVASVEHVLREEFGKTLADRDVHILDPFTGTGNFIVNIMRHIPKSALPHKFAHELHCNEVMLLPYYVASMNIEHTYYEATGKYQAFEGICLVDTFRTLEPPQTEFTFLSEKNSERVEKQKKAPIRVVIGNPPYNAWQADENENNRNQKYSRIDQRVKETYSEDSKAQNKNSLSDPYVKAFRYASDKIGEEGIVAFVVNNGFVDGMAADGMRKHLVKDFDLIYVIDLKGNIRKDSMRDGIPLGEKHTVFGLAAMVGICVCFLVKNRKRKSRPLFIHEVPFRSTRAEKFSILEKAGTIAGLTWTKVIPSPKGIWLHGGLYEEFDNFVLLVAKDSKGEHDSQPSIFREFGRGLETTRDDWVYGFDRKALCKSVASTADFYNDHVRRYARLGKKPKIDNFVDNDPSKIGWSSSLKAYLERGVEIKFDEKAIRPALYRPFTTKSLYFDNTLNHRVSVFPEAFPKLTSDNSILCVTDSGSEKPFMILAADRIADLHIVGAGASSQCLPLYTYVEDTNKKKFERRDNITPKALTLFQIFYDDDSITRENIFYYIYALLHHPTYRTRYAENLKRELPRIPFIGIAARKDAPAIFYPVSAIATMQGDAKPDHNPKASAKLFHAFADAGKKLSDLHVNYESAKEFPLKRIENKEVKLDWRVETMKLSKDKASLFYNDFLALSGIPAETFDYRLGNRSALEWVIDQYRVEKDEQGNLTSDPNRMDDEEYIVRLIGQVITVSLETQKLISTLPEITFE